MHLEWTMSATTEQRDKGHRQVKGILTNTYHGITDMDVMTVSTIHHR